MLRRIVDILTERGLMQCKDDKYCMTYVVENQKGVRETKRKTMNNCEMLIEDKWSDDSIKPKGMSIGINIQVINPANVEEEKKRAYESILTRLAVEEIQPKGVVHVWSETYSDGVFVKGLCEL